MRQHYIHILDGKIHASSQEVPPPSPGPSQLRVQVRAAGLNRGEILALRRSGSQAPTALGWEAAGEVIETGPECHGFHVGDRVMGRCEAAFADQALIDTHDAMLVPDSLSWIQAAAVPIVTLVVYDMLVMQGHLAADEWLLITGVSSGVGVAALQLAKSLGARVVGTSGSQEKLTSLAAYGLDGGIPTRQPDFHEAVMAATQGHGADLVVNIVGGSVLAECVRSMAFQGRLATVGYLDGVTSGPLDLAALHSQRLHLFGVSAKRLNPAQRHAIVQGVTRDVLPLFVNERMRPVVGTVFPFTKLADAIAFMESNAQTGKIVLSDQA